MSILVCVPLVTSEEFLGFLSAGHSDPNCYTQEHLRRAELLAIPAAAAIQNARLYQTAQIYGSELEKRIADLKQAEAALAQAQGDRLVSEEKFQRVFRSSPIPSPITTVKDGRFLDVNGAFERRYGYSREEALGHTVHELKIWEDPADRVRMVAEIQKSGPIRNEITRLRTKSVEVKLTAYSADRIQFDGQSCILAVSEDLPQSRLDPDVSEAFSGLQVERDPLSIDEHGTAVNDLLASAIIILVTAEQRQGKKELDGFRVSLTSCLAFGDGGTKTDPVEIRFVFEARSDRTNELGDVLIKRDRGNLVTRSRHGWL